MICTASDAFRKEVGEDEDDTLNQVRASLVPVRILNKLI